MAVRDYVAKYVADLAGYRLEPAIRETDKLGDTADATADSIVRDFQRAERGVDAASDAMARDAQTAGHKVRQNLGDAGKEAGQEFAQNLGESISSGDMSGLLSGTAGGLAATFGATGPIGLALGALAAVGTAAFAAIQAGAEQARQAAQTAFDELLNGADSAARFRARLEESFGTYEEGLAQADRWSRALGVPLNKIREAFTTGGPAARSMAKEADDLANAMVRAGEHGPDIGYLRNLSTTLKGVADQEDRAATAAERHAAAVRTTYAYARDLAKTGSSYAVDGSLYRSQLGAAYSRGGRG